MRRARAFLIFIFSITLLVALVGGLIWANLLYIRSNPGGREFTILWTGSRARLMEGLSPYSDLVQARLETAVLGRAATAFDPPVRFDFPFFVLIFSLPFATVNDPVLARALWMLGLELLLAALAVTGIRLVGWKPGFLLLALSLLFAVLWVHAVLPLWGGNLSILSAALLGWALLALRARRDELAGALLALACFRVETTLLLMLFLLLWSLHNRRWRVLAGAGMLMTLLLAGSFFLQPDWFLPYARAVVAVLRQGLGYTPRTLLELWFPGLGEQIGSAISLLACGFLAWEWWSARRQDFRHVLWTACLTLAFTPLVGLPVLPVNYPMLILPLLLVFSVMAERWGGLGQVFLMAIMLVLLAGLWAGYLSAEMPLQDLYFPVPVFLAVLLYWVRWWAIRPPLTWVELVNRTAR